MDDVVVRSGDQVLHKQETDKYLGVQIDKDLSWRLHIVFDRNAWSSSRSLEEHATAYYAP